MDKEKTRTPEGVLEVKKEFSKVLSNGTEIKVAISANMMALSKSDLEEVCSTFSVFARNFYMHLGNEVKSTP